MQGWPELSVWAKHTHTKILKHKQTKSEAIQHSEVTKCQGYHIDTQLIAHSACESGLTIFQSKVSGSEDAMWNLSISDMESVTV